jgi:hypothetical protein
MTVPSLPSIAGAQPLAKAYLEIEVPEVEDPIIPLRFNPTEYRLQKDNEYQDIAIPGLPAPPIQFVRGGAEKLSLEVLLDTTDTLKDVRSEYVDKLTGLMRIQAELHAPPIVRFVWDRAIFRGVIESLSVGYELFDEGGVPHRARAQLTMRAYRPVEVQVREQPTNSPDTEKSVTLRRGDRLDTLAERVLGNPNLWREIARANGIRDPRRLIPGRSLLIPRVQKGRRP